MKKIFIILVFANLSYGCGTQPDPKDSEGLTALHRALRDAFVASYETLASIYGGEGENRLIEASEHLKKAKQLIERGADVKAKFPAGMKITVAGENVGSDMPGGMTPLHFAVFLNSVEIAELLIEKGADVNAQDETGNTPMVYAMDRSSKRRPSRMVELLKKHGATAETKTPQSVKSEEHLKASQNDADTPPPADTINNITDTRGRTDLHLAARDGLLEKARRLIERIDVNTRDDDGLTPLHFAADRGHLEIARLLFNHRAKVNARNDDDQTPLHLAVSKGHLEVTKLLVDRNANINARDGNEKTPLMIAREKGYSEIVNYLESKLNTR